MTEDKGKTRERLITEIDGLHRRVRELEKEKQEYQQLVLFLKERAKELNCIYAVAQIIDEPNIPLREIYQQVADALPIGLQYPQITASRISIDDQVFTTRNHKETSWKLSADIEVCGIKRGKFEVFYLEEKTEIHQGPFFDEEWLLISIVAGRLGRLIERS
jgi:hypothetical protein